MTAKEMFEKLGYIQNEWVTEKPIIAFTKGGMANWKRVRFNITNKTINFEGTMYDFKSFNMEDMKAIQKQIEELGWE